MEYEWDENKNLSNIAKHGVMFKLACLVFEDSDRITLIDDRKDYGEIRYQTIGLVMDQVIFVVFTDRDLNMRIIFGKAGK